MRQAYFGARSQWLGSTRKKKKKKKKKRINQAETKTKSVWPGESQMSKFQLIKVLFCCSLALHLQLFSKNADVASQVGDAADIRCARFERAWLRRAPLDSVHLLLQSPKKHSMSQFERSKAYEIVLDGQSKLKRRHRGRSNRSMVTARDVSGPSQSRIQVKRGLYAAAKKYTLECKHGTRNGHTCHDRTSKWAILSFDVNIRNE